MKLKFDKNKEIFQNDKCYKKGGIKPFIRILGIKKDLISQVKIYGTPSGARTPDTLIKSIIKGFLRSEYY